MSTWPTWIRFVSPIPLAALSFFTVRVVARRDRAQGVARLHGVARGVRRDRASRAGRGDGRADGVGVGWPSATAVGAAVGEATALDEGTGVATAASADAVASVVGAGAAEPDGDALAGPGDREATAPPASLARGGRARPARGRRRGRAGDHEDQEREDHQAHQQRLAACPSGAAGEGADPTACRLERQHRAAGLGPEPVGLRPGSSRLRPAASRSRAATYVAQARWVSRRHTSRCLDATGGTGGCVAPHRWSRVGCTLRQPPSAATRYGQTWRTASAVRRRSSGGVARSTGRWTLGSSPVMVIRRGSAIRRRPRRGARSVLPTRPRPPPGSAFRVEDTAIRRREPGADPGSTGRT